MRSTPIKRRFLISLAIVLAGLISFGLYLYPLGEDSRVTEAYSALGNNKFIGTSKARMDFCKSEITENKCVLMKICSGVGGDAIVCFKKDSLEVNNISFEGESPL